MGQPVIANLIRFQGREALRRPRNCQAECQFEPEIFLRASNRKKVRAPPSAEIAYEPFTAMSATYLKIEDRVVRVYSQVNPKGRTKISESMHGFIRHKTIAI